MSKIGKALINAIQGAMNGSLIKLKTSFSSKANWQTQAIEKAVKKANQKNVKFIEHEKVSDWLKAWERNDEDLSD